MTSLAFRNFLLLSLLVPSSILSAHSQVLQRREAPVPEYVLGAGDQIILHVTDLDEITDKPIRVNPGGDIDVPLAGTVHAAGLTLTGLKQELAQKLAKYINNPEISVNVTDNQSRPISVFGSVNHAGVYQLQGPTRLLEAISLAGGLNNDAGNTVVVTRQSRWGKIDAPNVPTQQDATTSSVSLSMDLLTSGHAPGDNILIQPNDTISVPRAELVYVVGSVKKAGGFALTRHESTTVIQALSLAEGFGPNAAGSRARILRKPAEGVGPMKEIPVDANKILKGDAPDVTLLANDVLFIPNSALKQGSKIALDAAIGVTTGLAIYHR